MKKVNYSQIYQKFTKGLSPKTKDIFDRRFGVKTGEPETLEAIGKTLGITRERVRQIEEAGFNFVRKNNKEALDAIYADFANYFQNQGGFKKEEIALEEMGGKNQKPYVLFLLTLGEQFSKVCEKKDYHYFWSNLPSAQDKVKATLNSLVSQMQKVGKPIVAKDFYAEVASKQGLSQAASASYLEISKRIQLSREGGLGLVEWPEIKPRGVKDKAFLVFKKHGKPLHFTDVAKLIDKFDYNMPNKKTYPQTVHNELIKDPRFVLVGRGTYALADWGYVPGTIKDIITKVLSGTNQPMHKDEVVKQVLAQRLVAKNTVLMNLNNKTHFDKNSGDKYFLKGVQQN
ncbi:MAG: HTH domain-containing protein [Candidatus Staskawiczbacteria bacterium]|nr:HTH domain-containing protein [Candidatus Staskawiczbacteria bacterium]